MNAHPIEPQVAYFDGGTAWGDFRTQQMLERLQRVEPQLEAVRAQSLYLVATDGPMDSTDRERLARLLDARFAGSAGSVAADADPGPASLVHLVVAPRWGTVSPWASKASDLARNCALAVHRIERVTE